MNIIMKLVTAFVFLATFEIVVECSNLRPDGDRRQQKRRVLPANPQPHPRGIRTVFLDNFDRINTEAWSYDVSGWGGGNGEFQAYTPDKSITYARGGKLYIRPKLTKDVLGEGFMRGDFDFKKRYGYCTNGVNSGCKKAAKYLPAMSGKLSSKGAWKYGRVTVSARMPAGDWLWPAIWMLPRDKVYGTWPRSGEIDIVESRGNKAYKSIGYQRIGATLHWGLNGRNEFGRTHGQLTESSGSYANYFHTYILDWDQEGIRVSVDGKQMMNIRTGSGYCKKAGYGNCGAWKARAAPFDQKFYIILNNAVGGTGGFFPDGIVWWKPWKNSDGWGAAVKFDQSSKYWIHTWDGENAALQVDYVKVEQY